MIQRHKTVPIVVNGHRVVETGPSHSLQLVDAEISLASVTGSAVREILNWDLRPLQNLPLHEIVSFLYNVGQNWKFKDYSRRKLYIRDMVQYLGYSEEMAELEANWIAMLLSSQAAIYDIVQAELGNRHILDCWVTNEDCEIKAFPKGRSFHCLAGNVPLSSVTSILRALITKNQVIAKTASDDPFTPLALALSFQDVDASHPVAQAVSILHWPGGQGGECEKALIDASDVICVWGGRDAVRWAAGLCNDRRDVVFFGPKRSIAIVGSCPDPDEAARNLAHDVCCYDQRACFSVQSAFVLGDSSRTFADSLGAALALYDTILPKSFHSIDDLAAQTLLDQEALFAGFRTHRSSNGTWLVVECRPGFSALHPLGRSVLVHHIESLDEALPYVDATVQTVSVFPWALASDAREKLGRAGAARIVELGMSNVFRPGTAHDAMFPLQRLVRYVSCELPSAVPLKGLPVQMKQTKFLEERKFLEFVP